MRGFAFVCINTALAEDLMKENGIFQKPACVKPSSFTSSSSTSSSSSSSSYQRHHRHHHHHLLHQHYHHHHPHPLHQHNQTQFTASCVPCQFLVMNPLVQMTQVVSLDVCAQAAEDVRFTEATAGGGRRKQEVESLPV